MAAMLTMLGLTACAPGLRAPTPVPQGPEIVSLDGRTYVATIGAGSDGKFITSDGAFGVRGAMITVTGQDAPMTMDQGAVAKRAARAGCEGKGGRFHNAALGRYAGQGAWAFPGGCA